MRSSGSAPLFGRWTFRARLNSIHNSSSHTDLSMREYIIQRDTPTWTSISRIRSVVGRLTRSPSSRSHRLPPDLHLHLHPHLRLHPQLQLRQLQVHLHHLQPHLHRLRARLNLHLHLEPESSQHCASHREAATATSGRANRDKSATTFPWFRGARTIHPSPEMSGR